MIHILTFYLPIFINFRIYFEKTQNGRKTVYGKMAEKLCQAKWQKNFVRQNGRKTVYGKTQ